jgi:hypothetical protein
MSERERATIRIVGLAVHAVGLVLLVVAILAGSWSLGLVGALLFAVGGAWGWGMVAAAAKRAEAERLERQSHQAYMERTGQGGGGFRGTFDDDLPEATAITPPPPATPVATWTED